jgi:hypothetical protein
MEAKSSKLASFNLYYRLDISDVINSGMERMAPLLII